MPLLSDRYSSRHYVTHDHPIHQLRRIAFVASFILTALLTARGESEREILLPEVNVKGEKREVLHVRGYMREYSTLSTLTDTIFLFREKDVDFMIPTFREKKFKGWITPRLLGSRSFYRFTSANGIDSVSNNFRQHFSWTDRVGLIDHLIIPPQLRERGVASDTTYGSYRAMRIWHRDSDTLTLDIDLLADTTLTKHIYGAKNRRPSYGNVDFYRMDASYDFTNFGYSTASAENIVGMRLQIESTGRGINLFRLFGSDEPYYVSTEAELFVTDSHYVTTKEARRLERHIGELQTSRFHAPAGAPELSAETKSLIARVESIDHDKNRRQQAVDRSMMSRHFGKKVDRSLLGRLKSMFHLDEFISIFSREAQPDETRP